MAFIRQLGPVAVSWTVGQTDRRILHSDATGALLTSATHPSTPAGLIWTPTLDQYDKVAIEIALRIYLTIGFVALLGLSVMGVTSTDAGSGLRGSWSTTLDWAPSARFRDSSASPLET